MIRAIAVALALLAQVCALRPVFAAGYDPHVLVLIWQDGTVEFVPATTGGACRAAERAIADQLWRPAGGRHVRSMYCERRDLFRAAESCIAGFNCVR